MGKVKVDGEKKSHKVFLYTLSTCGWCKKTKQFLRDNKVEYEYLDFDTASHDERNAAAADINKRGIRMAFPIVLVDDKKCIVGFMVDSMKEALDL